MKPGARVRRRVYMTRALALAEVFDCIEVFYNRTAFTAIWAASVPRRSDRPLRKAGKCLETRDSPVAMGHLRNTEGLSARR